jgi:hypothetical protein
VSFWYGYGATTWLEVAMHRHQHLLPVTHSLRKIPDHGLSSTGRFQSEIAGILNCSKSPFLRKIVRTLFKENIILSMFR